MRSAIVYVSVQDRISKTDQMSCAYHGRQNPQIHPPHALFVPRPSGLALLCLAVQNQASADCPGP